MTIRLRYHLALLPLFLGITAANVAWYWVVESREIAWGLAEQAEGRALAVAAFIRSEDPLSGGNASALARLARNTAGLRASWFVSDHGAWSGQPLLQPPGSTAVPAPDEDTVTQLRTHPAVARQVALPAADHDEQIAYAGVPDPAGGFRAIIGLVEPDTVTRTERHRLVRTSASFAAALLLTGLIVTEGLARRARRDVAAVMHGAGALARGEYGHRWKESAIGELDDLAATLRSIDHILREGIQRTRRRLLRAQQLPGEEDVAAAYQQRCVPTSATSPRLADRCTVRRVGHGGPNDFWGVRRDGETWHAAVGRLQPGAETMPLLERVVRANAARDYILGQLVLRDPADAWVELDGVLPAVRGESVSWQPAGGAVPRLHAYGVDRSEPPPVGEGIGVLGTLDVETMRIAREYLHQFPQRPLEMLGDELAALCGERDRGVLLIFRLPSFP